LAPGAGLDAGCGDGVELEVVGATDEGNETPCFSGADAADSDPDASAVARRAEEPGFSDEKGAAAAGLSLLCEVAVAVVVVGGETDGGGGVG
jgi:hypothetical protein